jgi:hypothetical protein
VTTWQRPREVLSPALLEQCRRVGVAARDLVDDRAYQRAVALLVPALLEVPCAEPNDGHGSEP